MFLTRHGLYFEGICTPIFPVKKEKQVVICAALHAPFG